MRRKSPMFRHCPITLDSMSPRFSPDWAQFSLLSQNSSNLFRFLKEVRRGNLGPRSLKTSDSKGKPAKSPDERIIWYRSVVPERGQPTTKTGRPLNDFIWFLSWKGTTLPGIGASPRVGDGLARRVRFKVCVALM